MPIPSRRAAAGLAIFTGSPCHNISPESACSAPPMIFISVLLPAPFSPSTA